MLFVINIFMFSFFYVFGDCNGFLVIVKILMFLDLKIGFIIFEVNGLNLWFRFKFLNIFLWWKEGERWIIWNICGIVFNLECFKICKIYWLNFNFGWWNYFFLLF